MNFSLISTLINQILISNNNLILYTYHRETILTSIRHDQRSPRPPFLFCKRNFHPLNKATIKQRILIPPHLFIQYFFPKNFGKRRKRGIEIKVTPIVRKFFFLFHPILLLPPCPIFTLLTLIKFSTSLNPSLAIQLGANSQINDIIKIYNIHISNLFIDPTREIVCARWVNHHGEEGGGQQFINSPCARRKFARHPVLKVAPCESCEAKES